MDGRESEGGQSKEELWKILKKHKKRRQTQNDVEGKVRM